MTFLIGGAFALSYYTGIKRDTKDMDIFVAPQDYESGLELLGGDRFDISNAFPHWLGKASYGGHQIEAIWMPVCVPGG